MTAAKMVMVFFDPGSIFVKINCWFKWLNLAD